MNKITARIKSDVNVTKNGFVFKLENDGYAYTQIFQKQKEYIKRVIKEVEFKEYVKPKRTRKPKTETVDTI